MKFAVLLNRDGGALKSMDVDSLGTRLKFLLGEAGYQAAMHIVSGDELKDQLDQIIASDKVDVIVAGGGDGTVSLVAAKAWKHKKRIAVLPAGTMNLFARSIGMSLDIEAAITQIAEGRHSSVDILTANGKPILHQYSVGIQPEVVKKRDAVKHQSRFSKIFSGAINYFNTIARPPIFEVSLQCDDDVVDYKLSILCVTNNLYGRGHFPFADGLNKGKIGVYRAPPLGAGEYVKLTSDLFLGSWETNQDLTELDAQQVELRFKNAKHHQHATIDGELVKLEQTVKFQLLPGALDVIKPKSA